MLRTWIGNAFIGWGRYLGRSDGRELAVDLDNNTIGAKMVRPSRDQQAWDPDFYHRGNVFIDGYSNPIKPVVRRNKNLENPDTVDVEGAEQTATDGGEHVSLISSDRYQAYMDQHLIDQLLNPDEQWKKLWYTLIGIGLLLVVNVMLGLAGAGVI